LKEEEKVRAWEGPPKIVKEEKEEKDEEKESTVKMLKDLLKESIGTVNEQKKELMDKRKKKKGKGSSSSASSATPGSGNPSRKKAAKLNLVEELFESGGSSDESSGGDDTESEEKEQSAAMGMKDVALKKLMDTIRDEEGKKERVAYNKRVTFEKGAMMQKPLFVDLQGSVSAPTVDVSSANLQKFIYGYFSAEELSSTCALVVEVVGLHKSVGSPNETFDEWVRSHGVTFVGPKATKLSWILLGSLLLFRKRNPIVQQ